MTEPVVPRPGLSRPLRWLLVASLALNLLVAGLALGALLDGDGPHGRPRPVEMMLGPVARALDEDDRRAILGELDRSGVLDGMGRPARDAARRDMLGAIRQEPFDPAALAQVMDRDRERRVALQAAVQEAVVARIATMTPEERAAFADRLGEGPGRGGRD